MRRYRIVLQGRTFDVRLLDDPRGDQVRVEVDGELLSVGVERVPVSAEPGAMDAVPAPASPSPAAAAESTARPEAAVHAPLPGVVKSIAVRPGQGVAPNDLLLVIEAMKMDNVIRAQRHGVVGTVHVAEGRQVGYGELLLEFAD
jgi:biotin carboxyl carrier protein